MINDILNAVMQECKAFLTDKGGTVILKTDYKASNLPTYTMPLLLVDLLDASEALQYPGGRTQIDWAFALNSYANMLDPTIDDNSGESINLLKVIDDIRRHFSIGKWLTAGMTDILNNYCFKFTLSGITPADALNEDGLVMGYKIMFDSVGLDSVTDSVQDSIYATATIEQVNNPPFN